ncbi:Uroporphyrinogen decarboxylase in heme biosynthesis [Quaeritorhiza haematococci]|nr:Uroporphyrinogen decarboxylase in heme biosynthesis [Quaeritorhiza haematococci]
MNFPELKNDLIIRAAKGEPVGQIPVWIMRQAGRYLPEFRAVRAKYDFFTLCRTPSLACEVTIQPIERYAGLLDAAIIFSDILVVPQALGFTVEMREGSGPHFPEPIRSPADLARVKRDVDVDAELGYVYQAITLTRQQLAGRVPLFGFAGAPWTLMAYMIEGGGSKTLSKAKSWLFSHPKESHWLLQRITDVVVDFLVGQVKAGAQLLQVFDSWGGELSPQDFRKFSVPYLTQIAARVRMALRAHDLPEVPLVVFAKGAHASLDVLSSIGYDVVSLDWTIDPTEARQATKNRVTLQGNADPSLLYASPETIEKEVREMLQRFGTRRQYIANLGHGMYPDHDPERLRAYLEAIKKCGLELSS